MKPTKHTPAKHKKVTVSSIIACANLLTFALTVAYAVICDGRWADWYMPMGYSYEKAHLMHHFYTFFEGGLLSILESIVGLIAERIAKNKNPFGKIVNLIFLLSYALVIAGIIIVCRTSWYHKL